MIRKTIVTIVAMYGFMFGCTAAFAAPMDIGPGQAPPAAEVKHEGEIPVAVRGALTMVMIGFGGMIFTVRRRDAARARKRAIGDGWQLREVEST